MKHRILDEHWDEIFPGVTDKNSIVVTDITNVAEYLFGADGKRKTFFNFDLLPTVVSPWRMAFFECRYPGTVDHRWGVKSITTEIAEDRRASAYIDDVATIPFFHCLPAGSEQLEIIKKLRNLLEINPAKSIPAVPRWFTVNFSFATEGSSTKLLFAGMWIDYLDETGRVINSVHRYYDAIDGDRNLPKDTFPMPERTLVYLAISFAHCKNVLMVREKYDKKEQKKHTRKHGQESIRYRKLHIDSLKLTLRKESGDDVDRQITHGLPLHIARGHFKDFRSGPGLFGKFHGLYWWGQQLRGDKKHGKIEKEYSIS